MKRVGGTCVLFCELGLLFTSERLACVPFFVLFFSCPMAALVST